MKNRNDDAPLTKAEIKTGRPFAEVFPQHAAYARKRAKAGEAHKISVHLRLDPSVIAFFKRKGSGWQTRINDMLEAIVRAGE